LGLNSFPQQERMADDLCLLFYPVAFERLSRRNLIVVAAPGMAHQWQPPPPARLRLPHMGHFVNEMALKGEAFVAEVLAIQVATRVEPEMAVGRHGVMPGLKWPIFAPMQPHMLIVDRRAKDRRGEGSLGGRQGAG